MGRVRLLALKPKPTDDRRPLLARRTIRDHDDLHWLGELRQREADTLQRLVEHLRRVAMDNLIGNAWKYSSNRSPSRIEFGVRSSNGTPVFFVRDNGAGFDPRSTQRLFQPFQRLHPLSEFPGTGVGLATVQRIIQKHGGRIWAEGVVNEGATFSFTLADSAE